MMNNSDQVQTARNRGWLTKGLLLAAAILLTVGLLNREPEVPPVPDFSSYAAGAERKQAFFDYFLPLIEARNDEIRSLREQLEQWARSPGDIGRFEQRKLQHITEDYGMENFDINDSSHWQSLLSRVDIVPASLALAQAANESAWGTSRFAREGNNFYGQWCFSQGCGLVPGQRGDNKRHEVEVFESAVASVRSYIHNLNTHRAYKQLRALRAQLRAQQQPLNGPALARGLQQYSERGGGYIEELNNMISYNDLVQYDPQAIEAE